MRPDERVPPNSIEAENVALGWMMISREALEIAMKIGKPEFFYDPRNKAVFAAIIELVSSDEGVDLVSVAETLLQQGKLGKAGVDVPYLETLADFPKGTDGMQMPYYLRVLHERWARRELIYASAKIGEDAHRPDVAVESLVETLGGLTDQIESHRQGVRVGSREAAEELKAELAAGDVPWLPTGVHHD